MPHQSPPFVNEIVINWHVIEACNYKCSYCYAHWQKIKQPDIIHDQIKSKELLSEIGAFFRAENSHNPIRQRLRWSSTRLNIAGGEPLLCFEKTLAAAKFAREIGMNVSIITNGSRLTSHLIRDLAPHLSLLGLSIDATDDVTNKAIGRLDSNGVLLQQSELQEILDEGRRTNPRMGVKINTVVNAANWQEDMTLLILAIKPDRWKVLQMLPVLKDSLAVTPEQFNFFVDRHKQLSAVMSVEDNSNMTESYIMIDPSGRFFQNTTTPGAIGYRYSPSILDVGAANAFSSLNFADEKFHARYQQSRCEI